MRARPLIRLLLAACVACGVAHAQDTKSAKKCKPKDTSCAPATTTTPAPDKPLNEAFPFPTDDSKRGGEAEPAKPATSNGLPQMPTDPVPDPPSDSEKPLPRDSSSSLPPGTSSSAPDDDSDVAPTTADPNAPVKSAPLKNYGAREDSTTIRAKLDRTRVPDDVKVGRYYLSTGNNQGAYLRFKDATEIDAEDPDATFYLAEAAEKLNKKDEAVAAYRNYLKLDPDGDHDKDARRALAKLGAKP